MPYCAISHGLEGRSHDCVSAKQNKELRDELNVVVPTMVPNDPEKHCSAELPPDLAEVVQAWANIPEATRVCVLAAVRASLAHIE